MRQELSTILKYNLYRPDNAKLSLEVFFNSYSPYQYLLQQRRELPIFFDSALKNNDVTLKDYSKKITKFLDIAEKISKNSRKKPTTITKKAKAAKNENEMQEDEGRESGLSTSTLNTATANSDQVVRGMVLIDCTALNLQLIALAKER